MDLRTPTPENASLRTRSCPPPTSTCLPRPYVCEHAMSRQRCARAPPKTIRTYVLTRTIIYHPKGGVERGHPSFSRGCCIWYARLACDRLVHTPTARVKDCFVLLHRAPDYRTGCTPGHIARTERSTIWRAVYVWGRRRVDGTCGAVRKYGVHKGICGDGSTRSWDCRRVETTVYAGRLITP